MIRISPRCSTTKNRPLPSSDCSNPSGLFSPVTKGARLRCGGATAVAGRVAPPQVVSKFEPKVRNTHRKTTRLRLMVPTWFLRIPVSYTHLRAHETPEHLV